MVTSRATTPPGMLSCGIWCPYLPYTTLVEKSQQSKISKSVEKTVDSSTLIVLKCGYNKRGPASPASLTRQSRVEKTEPEGRKEFIMNKSDLEFLKFFNESIKNIHVLTEEMYAQMQEARNKLIDNYSIECYEVIEDLTTTIAKVSGKLDFLDDAFTRFANDCIEESEV